jgi:signal transduction histidine kinase
VQAPEIDREVDAANRSPRRGVYNHTRLLAIDSALRAHPAAAAILSVAAVGGISLAKVQIGDEFSLALSYGVPLSLCAYAVGPGAGLIMAVVVSLLWTLDAFAAGASAEDLGYSFLAKFVTNAGIVVVAALGAAAARARENHLAEQQRLEQLRTDLVSAFSHDLRTPLAAIIGYTELLHDDFLGHGVAPELQRTLDGITVNASRLNQLITDLLSIERDVNDAELQMSTFAPETLIAELRREFDYQRPSQAVAVEWSVAPQTPALHTDRRKLTSVVRNLVGNALKFTAAGTVQIRIAYRSDTAAHLIEVEDTGSGIASEDLPHIFRRFRQGRSTRRGQGFGLGLFIVERLTRMLGGSVTVDSAPGRGARFVVTLPLREKDAPPEPSSSRPSAPRGGPL